MWRFHYWEEFFLYHGEVSSDVESILLKNTTIPRFGEERLQCHFDKQHKQEWTGLWYRQIWLLSLSSYAKLLYYELLSVHFSIRMVLSLRDFVIGIWRLPSPATCGLNYWSDPRFWSGSLCYIEGSTSSTLFSGALQALVPERVTYCPINYTCILPNLPFCWFIAILASQDFWNCFEANNVIPMGELEMSGSLMYIFTHGRSPMGFIIFLWIA